MATAAFEDIVEDFAFLDDWEDRYRHVIDMGKSMAPLEDAFKVPATKVDGCASQVWIVSTVAAETVTFRGDSDAMIVRGLIAVILALFNGLTPAEISAVDAPAELKRLGLNEHLSAQRSNGVRAMIDRIKRTS